MSGLVYKVGDFEIDLMKVLNVEGDCLYMDNYRTYGVGAVAANAVRKIISDLPERLFREPPQGNGGRGQGLVPVPEVSSSPSPQPSSSAVQGQLECRSCEITSFPGDKAPEKDATKGTEGTAGTAGTEGVRE